MRIISKFRDYYDPVQAHGADPNLVYRRATSEQIVEARLFPSAFFEEKHREVPYLRPWRLSLAYLCFCGKSYAYLFFEGLAYSTGTELLEAYRARAREHPEVRDYSHNVEALLDIDRKSKRPYHEFLTSLVSSRRGESIGPELFRKLGAPVLLVHRCGNWTTTEYWIKINPCLSDFRFYQLFDPFAAYQELAMYLGNELAQPDIAPQTVGSDKDLAKAKGFDDQSFRTAAPGKKKLNRRANKSKKRGQES